MPLFGRIVQLQIGVPGQEGRLWTTTQFAGPRIAFRVKKNLGKNANESSIQIINLNEESVSLLHEPEVLINLFAGHENIPRLIFRGSPIKDGVKGEWQSGIDFVLKIDAQDGGRQIANGHTNETFATETKLEQVLTLAAKDLGVPLGDIGQLADVRLTQGVTLSGPTRDILDRVARMNKATWTINDGALDLILTDGDSGDSAVLLSETNGNLLAIKPKDKNKIEVVAILDGRIRPGKRFVVESSKINGIYKARDMELVGDTHDENFIMMITAKAA